MIKRVFSAILCIFILACMPVMAQQEPGRDLSLPQTLAVSLQELNLMKGVGLLPDGGTDFDLARPPKRVEALVMLIRVLGAEQEAMDGTWSHPFLDVPDWADAYVGFAYEQGLTNGVSDTSFDPSSPASLRMYLTFMLRALGHSDGEGGDFSYAAPEGPAREVGILPDEVAAGDFWRADAVLISYAALGAHLADGSETLAERLARQGVFTQADFDRVYDATVFQQPTAVSEPLRLETGVRSFSFTIANADRETELTALWLSDGSVTGGDWQWTEQGWVPFEIQQDDMKATYTTESDIDFEHIPSLKIRYIKHGETNTAEFGCPIEDGGRYWLNEEQNMNGGWLMTPKS